MLGCLSTKHDLRWMEENVIRLGSDLQHFDGSRLAAKDQLDHASTNKSKTYTRYKQIS